MNLRTLLLQMSVFDFGLSDMRNWQCTISRISLFSYRTVCRNKKNTYRLIL